MNIELKTKHLDAVLKSLSLKAHTQISLNTLNKTGDKIFTESKRLSVGPRGRYNLKGGQKALGLKKKRGNRSSLTYRINARKKPLSLMDFKPRQIKAGVKVAIVKGKPSTVKNAFIAQPRGRKYKRQSKTVSSPHQFVFKRKTTKAYPIKLLRGISPWKMVNRRYAMVQYKKIVNKEGPNILRQQLKYIMVKGLK